MYGSKHILWITWSFCTLIGTILAILALVTFANLNGVKHLVPGSQLDAALTATLLSAIFVGLLQIVSFFVLLRQTTWAWQRNGRGFAYAFITATYLNLSFFLLLTGMVLIANHHWLNAFEAASHWSTSDSTAYVATYVMCFILAGTFIIAFVALVMMERSVLKRTTGLSEIDTALRGDLPLSNLEPAEVPADYRESVAASSRRGAWGIP